MKTFTKYFVIRNDVYVVEITATEPTEYGSWKTEPYVRYPYISNAKADGHWLHDTIGEIATTSGRWLYDSDTDTVCPNAYEALEEIEFVLAGTPDETRSEAQKLYRHFLSLVHQQAERRYNDVLATIASGESVAF